MQDDHCDKNDLVHGQGLPDDAGKPGAEKSARRVWREAFGKGLPHSTSPGAYPTSSIVSRANALRVSPFRREHKPEAVPSSTSSVSIIVAGDTPLCTT
jgi:hypothetical protein